MPRHRPPKNHQRRDRRNAQALQSETHSSGKWIGVGGLLLTLIIAGTSLWLAVRTPTSYEYSETLTQKAKLEIENEKLKEENRGLQEGISRSKDELSRNIKNIEIQKSTIDKLQMEKERLETEIPLIIEKKNFIEDQNVSLLEKSGMYEVHTRELLVSVIFDSITRSLIYQSKEPIILVQIKMGEDEKRDFIIMHHYNMHDKFTNESWSQFIDFLKTPLTDKATGEKREIRHKDDLTLKALIEDELEQFGSFGQLEKDFTQELHSKLNDYAQKNKEVFSVPLRFVLTGIDMKVKEANKERERLLSILGNPVYVGYKTFSSKMEEEVFKLFEYLGYKK